MILSSDCITIIIVGSTENITCYMKVSKKSWPDFYAYIFFETCLLNSLNKCRVKLIPFQIPWHKKQLRRTTVHPFGHDKGQDELVIYHCMDVLLWCYVHVARTTSSFVSYFEPSFQMRSPTSRQLNLCDSQLKCHYFENCPE